MADGGADHDGDRDIGEKEWQLRQAKAHSP